jgi:hypothetical protein
LHSASEDEGYDGDDIEVGLDEDTAEEMEDDGDEPVILRTLAGFVRSTRGTSADAARSAKYKTVEDDSATGIDSHQSFC